MRADAKHAPDTRDHHHATGWHQVRTPSHFWNRSKRFIIRTLCIAAVLTTLLLLGALAMASANTDFFERYYTSLYGVNVIVILIFLAIIAGLVGTIILRLYQGKFGARLLAKLAIFFAIVGVLPGSILYLVSLQFVSRSIESWFDDHVETALVSGLNLGQSILDTTLLDVQHKARAMANQLAAKRTSQVPLSLTLSRIREQLGLYSATVFSTSGKVEAQAVESALSSTGNLPFFENEPINPTAFMFRQARSQQIYAAIESDMHPEMDALGSGLHAPARSTSVDQGALWVRVITIIPSGYEISLEGKTSFLQILQPIAPELARRAQEVQQGYRDYQEKSLSRQGLRKMYIGTLTLALFLASFIAILLAVVLGNQLARPLFLLALGTQEVIRGDYTPKREIKTNDELGFLTQAFSAMTRQLSEARFAAEQNRAALEDSHAYLENILQNLTAGVLVFDNQFRLTTANPGAERIFQQNFQSALSMPLHEMKDLGEFNTIVRQAFMDLKKQGRPQKHRTDKTSNTHTLPLPPTHWQRQCEITLAHDSTPTTLLVRGTRLTRWTDKRREINASTPGTAGYVVVFDDISDLISAQRSLAWGEVARRLAHEIKNPLTPIRLSIEQLDRKLAPKLDEKDANALHKGTEIILNQVDAMKQMVDDFRDYARTPPAVLQAVHLNDLITEIFTLYASEEYAKIIHLDLAPLPLISADPAQLRQVIHNLLQNALDAITEQTDPHIWIQTRVIEQDSFVKETQNPSSEHLSVRLTLSDNGPGFSKALLKRALEPYVTTKAKGTGLGLAVVKKIIDEHGALIDIQNRTGVQPELSSIDFEYRNSLTKSPEIGNTQAVQGAQISITFMHLAPLPSTEVQAS